MDGSWWIAHAYLAVVAFLGLYGAHRFWMLLRFHWRVADPPPSPIESELPVVTVQLPLFNERTVAARLIQTVGELDYPRGQLEIQVLDDSTDETRCIAGRAVMELRERGIDAKVIHRSDRLGFKAGALDHGMTRARGELLCIFDADFLPPPQFLRLLVPHFQDPKVGMVQARWEHLNRDENTLTRAQSTLLDGHFVIEHKVRADGGLFFNFNGTAGIWRRSAIESSGGWQHDTLTEDLDLSYRAQLDGWRFVYAPMVCAAAEVPPDISSFKSQQHRWAKGSVQVTRKLARRILAADVPIRVKLEAIAHLTGNTGYPFVLLLALLLPLSISKRSMLGPGWHIVLFLACTLSVILFYERSQRAVGRARKARLKDIPAAMSLGVGMCVSQTRAVLEGLFQKTGEFVRTPKRGDDPAIRRYGVALRGMGLFELLLAAWLAWAVTQAVRMEMWGSLPFLCLFFSGFVWVGSLSLRAWMRTR